LNNEDGDTMLHLAVRSGNAEVVRFVVEETGANVNKPNFNQDTALHQAARLGMYLTFVDQYVWHIAKLVKTKLCVDFR
jgi:ankyrin repeat protein